MKKQLVIAGIVILLVCVGFSGCESNKTEPTKDRFGWSLEEVKSTGEAYIGQFLKDPSSAEFSNVKVGSSGTNSTYNKYVVTGYVKSLNSFGVMVQSSFYIHLDCYSNGFYNVTKWDIFNK